MKKLLLIISLLVEGFIFAAEGFDESVDRNDPNFVHASILYCGPGKSLYACVGHIAIRLQCPHYELDEVFSYEGEPMKDQWLRFFLGKLNMGMFATPFKDFLKEYAEEGRGVTEYKLNLSPQAEVRLWKLMDERVAEGPYLPYDYVRRGCAQSTVRLLLKAIDPEPIKMEVLPKKFHQTRRDILHDHLAEYPWNSLFISMISGPEADYMASTVDSVIMPRDFLEYLGLMRIKGEKVLAAEPVELQSQTLLTGGQSPFGWGQSPMGIACLLFVLSIIGCFVGKKWISAALLVLYGLLAVFETYISILSNLPAAAWNVLLIAFNPLPLIFWKWRKYWGLPYAAVLIGWSAWVFLAPHLPTDPAFAILALAYSIIFYFRGRH